MFFIISSIYQFGFCNIYFESLESSTSTDSTDGFKVISSLSLTSFHLFQAQLSLCCFLCLSLFSFFCFALFCFGKKSFFDRIVRPGIIIIYSPSKLRICISHTSTSLSRSLYVIVCVCECDIGSYVIWEGRSVRGFGFWGALKENCQIRK